MVDVYWTISGLFNGTLTFFDRGKANVAFEQTHTTWDSEEIRLIEHKIIRKKTNPNAAVKTG